MAKEMTQPEGNYYDKYGSKNPIVRRLMDRFFSTMDGMLDMAGDIGGGILEAGCGEGNVVRHICERLALKDAKAEFYAFDISKRLMEENRKRYPDVMFFEHNIYEAIEKSVLPQRGQFDLVVCCEVLEHLEEPEKAILNLMKNADRFIFSVPNEPVWRFLNMARGKYMKDLGNTPGHVRHWSERTFVQLLNGCGLRCAEIKKPLPWLMVYCEKADT